MKGKTLILIMVVLASLSNCKGPHSDCPSLYLAGRAYQDTIITSEMFDTIADKELEQAIIDNLFVNMYRDLSNEMEVVNSFTEPQRTIYIISVVEAQINHDGFKEFYFHSMIQYAEKSEDAFKQIGATKFANVMHKANEVLRQNKEQLRKEHVGTIESSNQDSLFSKLDGEFYRTYGNEDLKKLKIEFIRKNKPAFITRKTS